MPPRYGEKLKDLGSYINGSTVKLERKTYSPQRRRFNLGRGGHPKGRRSLTIVSGRGASPKDPRTRYRTWVESAAERPKSSPRRRVRYSWVRSNHHPSRACPSVRVWAHRSPGQSARGSTSPFNFARDMAPGQTLRASLDDLAVHSTISIFMCAGVNRGRCGPLRVSTV